LKTSARKFIFGSRSIYRSKHSFLSRAKKISDYNTPTPCEKKERMDYIITTTKAGKGYNSAR
jgi:hypothetical protein